MVLPTEKGHIEFAAEFKAWQGEGDYVELGVYAGKSFVRAYRAIKEAEKRRGRKCKTRFIAFDSFRGLPKLQGLDAYYARYAEGAYSASQEEFMCNITRHGVDAKDVTIVPGFYGEISHDELRRKYRLSKISMAYLDCDLYSSTAAALDMLTPFLTDGCMLIFADWYLFQANPALGQQRAFKEWLEKTPDISASRYLDTPTEFHASFIIHRALQMGKS
jgi:hypothetical protein